MKKKKKQTYGDVVPLLERERWLVIYMVMILGSSSYHIVTGIWKKEKCNNL